MKFQPPRGMRDFYPQQMAWRNYLVSAWRRVSIRNGFEEVDGPIFEALDLYKVKSGEGIVSELFHFADRGERELAIRAEFTPTLARMVAAQANSLPRPIKWFCVPNLCRAEKPQRGRAREHWQWNVDIVDADTATADAECIFVAVDLLAELGLRPDQVRIKISHRQTIRQILLKLGVPDAKMIEAFTLLDRRDKIPPEEFKMAAAKLDLDEHRVLRFEEVSRRKYPCGDIEHLKRSIGMSSLADLEALDAELAAFGIADWCEYDLGIVRGLAYYTGTVFEIHEISGAERAIAGGGRYDQLIELFGGPKMSAVGYGMGDLVLTNVLIDKKLMPQELAPRPDAFVLALTDAAQKRLPGVVAALRRAGVHARFSYKSTRNLGKLLKEADAARARFAVILDDQVEGNTASVKDLASGEQREVPLSNLPDAVR